MVLKYLTNTVGRGSRRFLTVDRPIIKIQVREFRAFSQPGCYTLEGGQRPHCGDTETPRLVGLPLDAVTH